MPTFFNEYINENPIITGTDAHHIIKALRMKAGEKINICDTMGYVYECEIANIAEDKVFLKILNKEVCQSEPKVKVTLYQGIVKGDKADYIVQKSVELGVYEIVFVDMDRSVSKPNKKAIDKKLQRWNKISLSAAKQSGRGYIPQVKYITSVDSALKEAESRGTALFFYELATQPLKQAMSDIVNKGEDKLSVFIGPEGGFSLEEVDAFNSRGIEALTLGKRILRTETAPVVALSIIMYELDN